MENKLTEYLSDYRQLQSSEAVSILESIVQRHPWFTLGRYMLLRAGGMNDSTRRLYKSISTQLEAHPYPQILLFDQQSAHTSPMFQHGEQMDHTARMSNAYTEVHSDSMIDSFLSRPITRITPIDEMDNAALEDISIASVTPDDEIATETLAQILLSQGHIDQAVEIYYKLSLKYPEKSSYFAGLIADIRSSQQ